MQQDPVISRVKWIAEPRDVGECGYRGGNLPRQWSERNARYREAEAQLPPVEDRNEAGPEQTEPDQTRSELDQNQTDPNNAGQTDRPDRASHTNEEREDQSHR